MKIVLAREEDGYADAIRRRLPGATLVLERDALAEALVDADAVVCNRLAAADVEHAARLRLIQATSAGADAIDRSAVPADCVVCNVRGHEQAMAEWVVMAMLALRRSLLTYDRGLRAGEWHRFGRDALPEARDLRGSTLGAIGFGQIGRAVARLARAFGMDSLAVTRTPDDARAGEIARLDAMDRLPDLLREADFAVVCLPGGDETRGLIGAAELELLGPSSYLVNVARGEIVDERALYEALRARTIAGAALDVWYRYPRGEGERIAPSAFPFHELDNVLMTPHVSGHAESTTLARREFVADQLVRLAEGRPLENVVARG